MNGRSEISVFFSKNHTENDMFSPHKAVGGALADHVSLCDITIVPSSKKCVLMRHFLFISFLFSLFKVFRFSLLYR